MPKHHPENERLKHRYRIHLADAKGRSAATIATVMAALARFEVSTGHRPFKAFNPEQARAFKRKLLEPGEGQAPLSVTTAHHICKALQDFFVWLADQPGFRSRVRYTDAEFFSLSGNQVTAARSAGPVRPVPTLPQIDRVLSLMPAATDVQLRDRALIAAAILTGARDGALASAQLRHVDMAEGTFHHDGRTMKVKFGKVFTTWFFPVSDTALAILGGYVGHLRTVLLLGETDPLFPSTQVELNRQSQLFEARGLTREHWSSAAPIRDVFRKAFDAAGLPYANPHSFRKTLAEEGRRRYWNDVERLQAWSQNLGHESLMTTLRSYGAISPQRQAEIMRERASIAEHASDAALGQAVRRAMMAGQTTLGGSVSRS